MVFPSFVWHQTSYRTEACQQVPDQQLEKAMPPQAASELKESLLALYEAHDGKVSDKWASYIELYDTAFKRFRDKPIRILEIGIQNGGSLEIWARFFQVPKKS